MISTGIRTFLFSTGLALLVGYPRKVEETRPHAVDDDAGENKSRYRHATVSQREWCLREADSDRLSMERLARRSLTARVVMFGIDHGPPDGSGDKRDGEFVSRLLAQYKRHGFNYVAVEGPSSLNGLLDRRDFEERAREVFGEHWTEFGPVIQRARELRMRLVFYDTEIDWRGSYSEREQVATGNLERRIFGRDPSGKVIVYCGSKHLHKEPVEVSWLDQTRVQTIGGFLHQRFGDRLITVYLVPENTGSASVAAITSSDYFFHLDKSCQGGRRE